MPFLTRRRFLTGAAATGLGGGALAAWLLHEGLRPAGPYLQDVGPDRVTVAAITPRAERVALTVTGAGSSATSVRDEAPQVIRGLVVSGLSPATEYAYQLTGEDGRRIGAGTFRTAPAPGSAGPVRFFALGDSGVTEGGDDDDPEESSAGGASGGPPVPNQWKVAVAMQRLPRPDFVLHTGDLVYPKGAPADFSDALFDPFAPLLATAPLYPTLGNHDLKTGRGAPYLERFFLPEGPDGTSRSYAFEWGDALFVSFEAASSSRGAAGPLDWLDRTLAASQRRWKVVFFHVPPFGPCGRMDCPPLKEHLVPILVRNRVDLVLNGHDHLYARYRPIDGVTYVITGGGGGKLYAAGPDERLAKAVSAFHFLEGTIEGPRLTLRAIGTDGQELDRVTLEKGPG